MKIDFLKINSRSVFVFLCFCVFVFLLIIGFRGSEQAEAQTGYNTYGNVHGWAWSDNIGWISFNCYENPMIGCALSPYGVMMGSGGDLVGEAWSDNIGWIQFGGLSNFPSGSGSTSADANLSGGALTGWAKAIGGAPGVSPYTQSFHHGGWDGWISLLGTGPDYGITQSGNDLAGFAWGDEVIGWIDFTGVTVDAEACVLGLTATPNILPQGGGSVTLEWTGNNLDLNEDCTVNWNTAVPAPDPMGTETISITEATTFFISCPCQDGGTVTASDTVTLTTDGDPPWPPQDTSLAVGLYLSAADGSLECPNITTLTWGIDDSWGWGLNPGSDPNPINTDISCDVSWDTIDVDAPTSIGDIKTAINIAVNLANQNFWVTCFDDDGNPVFQSTPVYCIITDPVLDLSIIEVDNQPILDSQGNPTNVKTVTLPPAGGDVTLTWFSDYVDQCETFSTDKNVPPNIEADAVDVSSNPWDDDPKLPTPANNIAPEETYTIPTITNTGFFMQCSDDNANFVFDTVLVWVEGDNTPINPPGGSWNGSQNTFSPPLGIPRFEER